MTRIDDCRIIQFPQIRRPEGGLTTVESHGLAPFDIARVYYLYDVPGGETRGGHAHQRLEQIIVSAMGSFTVRLDDGRRRKSVTLKRAFYGLYVPSMIWRDIVDFSSGGICLVLASLPFDEREYVRDYDQFILRKRQDESSLS